MPSSANSMEKSTRHLKNVYNHSWSVLRRLCRRRGASLAQVKLATDQQAKSAVQAFEAAHLRWHRRIDVLAKRRTSASLAKQDQAVQDLESKIRTLETSLQEARAALKESEEEKAKLSLELQRLRSRPATEELSPGCAPRKKLVGTLRFCEQTMTTVVNDLSAAFERIDSLAERIRASAAQEISEIVFTVAAPSLSSIRRALDYLVKNKASIMDPYIFLDCRQVRDAPGWHKRFDQLANNDYRVWLDHLRLIAKLENHDIEYVMRKNGIPQTYFVGERRSTAWVLSILRTGETMKEVCNTLLCSRDPRVAAYGCYYSYLSPRERLSEISALTGLPSEWTRFCPFRGSKGFKDFVFAGPIHFVVQNGVAYRASDGFAPIRGPNPSIIQGTRSFLPAPLRSHPQVQTVVVNGRPATKCLRPALDWRHRKGDDRQHLDDLDC